jgi:hypothetical protein
VFNYHTFIFLFFSFVMAEATVDVPPPAIGTLSDPALLTEFFKKDEVTICVTDVGLGGMSVLSEIERRLQDIPLFPKV